MGNRTVDQNGKKLDEKTANSVRLSTGLRQIYDSRGNRTYQIFEGVKDLGISQENFQKTANIVMKESQTGDAAEMLYIAHTAKNHATHLGMTISKLLSTNALCY